MNFSNSDDAKAAMSQMDGQVSQTSGPMFEVWLLVCRSCLNGDLKQMLVKVARLCSCVSSTVISL